MTPDVTFSEDARRRHTWSCGSRPDRRTIVDHVVIAGPRASPARSVVGASWRCGEGEALGLERVLESQRRLGGLGIFERVTHHRDGPRAAAAAQRGGARRRRRRAPPWSYGIGYAEQDLLRGSVEVTRRNLFGMDRSLSAFARGSFRGQPLPASTFREP